jgi:DNA polymerase-1
MTLQVHQVLYPRLAAIPGMKFVYESIEMPTSAVLGRVERHGVLIDSARLADQSRVLAERMMALENEAYEIAGQPFNLGSPKQIGEILFGKLGLPVAKKTAVGRAVHRRRACWRSWRWTTRCRPSCWSIAGCPS